MTSDKPSQDKKAPSNELSRRSDRYCFRGLAVSFSIPIPVLVYRAGGNFWVCFALAFIVFLHGPFQRWHISGPMIDVQAQTSPSPRCSRGMGILANYCPL